MTALAALARVRRLGWVGAGSPVEAAPALAAALGVPALWLKRDDRLDALHGGTKVRKLDVLLASPPFADARGWVTSGATGSGQVVAVAAAGRLLDRPVHAHLFRTPLGEHGLENLAFSASHATTVAGYRSRVDLALRAPAVLLAAHTRQGAVIPPGATCGPGTLGCVLGGLELAEQIAAGQVPRPDAVYLPLGSGGTAVGVAVGLALAGVDVPVRAVAVVEWVFAPRSRLRSLERQVQAELSRHGLASRPARIEVVRGFVGAGYARATPASEAAAAHLRAAGVAGEPVYTGKAVAALARDAALGRTRAPLYWVTVRRPGLECAADWRDRLPALLRAGLDTPALPGPTAPSRRAIVAGAAAAAGLVGVARCTGYDGPAGEVLSAAERAVVRAAGEALFPDAATAALDVLPDRVDRYLLSFPPPLRAEVHALFLAVEQTLPFAAGLRRFTRLTPGDRLLALQRFGALGEPGALVARSMRDLVLVAWYQGPESWAEIGYEGPMVEAEARPSPYDALRAPPGWTPFTGAR